MNALDSRACATHKISGKRRILPYIGGRKISPAPVPRDYLLPPPIASKHLANWHSFAAGSRRTSRPGTSPAHGSQPNIGKTFSFQWSGSLVRSSSVGSTARPEVRPSTSLASSSSTSRVSQKGFGQERASTAPERSGPRVWWTHNFQHREDDFSQEEWAAGFASIRSPNLPSTPVSPNRQYLNPVSLSEASSTAGTGKGAGGGQSQVGAKSAPDQASEDRTEEEPKWRSVFLETAEAESAKIPRGQISKALQLVGFSPLDQELLDTVMREATGKSYPTDLDSRTFGSLVALYENAQHEKMVRIFQKSDLNNDATLSRVELTHLVRYELDFKMFPHVIDEVFAEVDVDHSGCVDFSEFAHVMQILQQRQGFSKSEVASLRSAFQRFAFDPDGSDGLVPISKLGRLLAWLGYSATPAELRSLADEIDKDGDGTISELEFPLFLRKYRESELEKVGRYFGEHDVDQNGSIDRSELQELVWNLGFMLEPVVLDEFIEEAGLTKVQNLLFEQFYALLLVIRQHGGFSRAETQHHDETFHRYAQPLKVIVKTRGFNRSLTFKTQQNLSNLSQRRNSGDVKRMLLSQLGRALRWLGFTFTAAQLQRLAEEATAESHSLDQEEFRKVLRKLREDEVKELRRTFPSPAAGQSPRRINPASPEFLGLLRRLGCTPTKVTMDKALQKLDSRNAGSTLDLLGALLFTHSVREFVADSCRNNAGFSDREVAKWRQLFNKFDRDMNDSVNQNELIRLMDKVMADVPPSERTIIADEALAGGEGDGVVDFAEFLLLMRGHHDRTEEVRLKQAREKLMKEKAEAEGNRIRDLQELFEAADEDRSGSLSVEEVKTLISGVLGPALEKPDVQHKLGMLILEIDADSSGTMCFDEFSNLIMRLEEEDLAGINTRAKEVLRNSHSMLSMEDC